MSQKYLVTMNMPSSQGFLVHQITIEHQSDTIEDLFHDLNDNEFILVRLFYRRQNDMGVWTWIDKGEIIVNSSHIGKVQLYIEYGVNDDDTYGNTEVSTQHGKLPRGPIRPRR